VCGKQANLSHLSRVAFFMRGSKTRPFFASSIQTTVF
jgi:hypothetical protein